MKIHIIYIIALCVVISACATTRKSPPPSKQTSELQNYSSYIAAAISDWIAEEAQTKQLNYVKLLTNEQGISRIDIEKRLQLNAIKITNDESIPSLKVSYSVSEIDDKILIRIKTDAFEATRLFSKAEGNSIIPTSPLSLRELRVSQ